MKQILLFIFLSGMIASPAWCQQNGELTPDIMDEIRRSYKSDDYATAMTNAVSANDIRKLALNRDNIGKTDHHFKHRVEVKGITNQEHSGRCWMFTGLNVYRPRVIEKLNLESFEFSTNYLFFWDQMEKANLFLEGIIATRDKPHDDRTVEWLFRNAIYDGGVWNLFTDLVQKYGLVPKDIMPETNSSENTSLMSRLIRRKLREDGLQMRKMAGEGADTEQLRKKKTEMLCEIYRMLAINLGEPPEKFSWRYKNKENEISEVKDYTPLSFFKEFVTEKPDDYVLMMDDPTRDYYKLYEIEYDRNMVEGRNWRFINLPASEIKEYAKKSIDANEAMYLSCDVGKQLNSDEGLLSVENYDYEAVYGVKFGMDKKDRIMSYESGSSHAMALVGYDENPDGKITKWLLENSWGAEKGHNGYLTMTDEWFDEYMFRVVVNKKFVDDKTLNLLKLEPVMLPPWDPMFSADM